MHFGGQKENDLDFTGAHVSSEPQKSSRSNQIPFCWVKEQLGVLSPAPVMPPALDNPLPATVTASSSLGSTGQALCA